MRVFAVRIHAIARIVLLCERFATYFVTMGSDKIANVPNSKLVHHEEFFVFDIFGLNG